MDKPRATRQKAREPKQPELKEPKAPKAPKATNKRTTTTTTATTPPPAKRAKRDEPKAVETEASHPSGMMTNDMREREAIYFKRFGKKMPVYKPQLHALMKKGVATYGPATPTPVEVEDESEEDLGEEYMDGPSFTQHALDNWENDPATFRRENFPFQIPPQSTDSPEASLAFKLTSRIY
jgi:hypothetical protein